MLTEQEARHLVETELAAMNFHGGLVIVEVQQVSVGWVYFYDSVQHAKSGLVADALAGNAPLLVDRRTRAIHGTGTARPVEDYIAEYIE